MTSKVDGVTETAQAAIQLPLEEEIPIATDGTVHQHQSPPMQSPQVSWMPPFIQVPECTITVNSSYKQDCDREWDDTVEIASPFTPLLTKDEGTRPQNVGTPNPLPCQTPTLPSNCSTSRR